MDTGFVVQQQIKQRYVWPWYLPQALLTDLSPQFTHYGVACFTVELHVYTEIRHGQVTS